MNTNLSPLEYEGLEYLLTRMAETYEREMEIETDYGTIRSQARRIPEGIKLINEYPIGPFSVERIFFQQGTVILVAYRNGPNKEPDPILIDMTEFLDQDKFDIELLIYRLYRHS